MINAQTHETISSAGPFQSRIVWSHKSSNLIQLTMYQSDSDLSTIYEIRSHIDYSCKDPTVYRVPLSNNDLQPYSYLKTSSGFTFTALLAG